MLEKLKANWKTSLIATMAVPELLRQLANVMDSDPTTVFSPAALIMAFGMALGFYHSADAEKPDAPKAKSKR